MILLLAAACVFLGIHLVVSGTPLRDAIVGKIGEQAYLGLFSLFSLGAIVWLCVAYDFAGASAGNRVWFVPGAALKDFAIPVLAVAFALAVPGILSPNPTSVGQEKTAGEAKTVRGVLRITRHPFLWGVALWSGFHLAATGDGASVIFFGTFLALTLLGTLAIDAKRKRKLGALWQGFSYQTSNIPFAAILSGRTRFHLGEYLDWRFAAAVGVFLVLLFVHTWLFGASPFPAY